MTLREDQPILVTGAEGFIGKDVVRRLLERGWRMRAMLREGHSLPFGFDRRLEGVHADMRDQDSLRRALNGVALVVHLAAAKSDEADSEDVNVGGAKRLVNACHAEGCSRLINISTLSAEISQKGIYARTKSAADNIFHNSGLRVTTLRPSIVYGEENGGGFGTILNFVRRLAVVPVPGDGQWLSAPVYVGDLSKAIIGCVENDQTIGKIYHIGGPDLITFDALISKISSAVGVRRFKVHIPFRLSLWVARTLVALWPKCPITVSTVLGSSQNADIDIEPARHDFGFNPLKLDQGLGLVFNRTGRDPSESSAERTAADFRLIASYLLDADPPPELVNRYVDAHRALLGDEIAPEWEFARKHRAALPYLDAASAVLSPHSLLRKKLLLAAAILEATPVYAHFFLKEHEGPIRVLCYLFWQGICGAAKLSVGAPLLFIARRK